ncbi:CHORD [Symbiodinium microadriaticum]|nr:CHORD [Symbiodinium microadriaticum]CAE7675783.1 CHORD [Symbiodinium sp. KB8]
MGSSTSLCSFEAYESKLKHRSDFLLRPVKALTQSSDGKRSENHAKTPLRQHVGSAVFVAMASGDVVAKPPEHVRCKNFGCSQFFDPRYPEQTVCTHHRLPPVFHETAKYWACCPDKKAYDWDEFMKIPGCQTGHCTSVAKDKKFLGGADIRAEHAPKRLDDEVPVDPRKKLDRLREGLVSLGVSADDFDRAWGRLGAKLGDLSLVAQKMNQLFTETLQTMDTDDMNLPD